MHRVSETDWFGIEIVVRGQRVYMADIRENPRGRQMCGGPEIEVSSSV